MKFARQLAAVLLLVGTVVAVCLAWGHVSGAGQNGFVFYGGGGPGLSLSNSGDLIRTVELDALIMAVVITISVIRRRRRRAARAASPPG